jgi:hypothetical protein
MTISGIKDKKLVISVHIPKTGGTSFVDLLKIVAEEVLYLDYGNDVFAGTAVYRRGQRVEETFESIKDLQSLPGRSVIHGHFRIDRYLGRFPDAAYVTWLRDPVERIASHYFFWQRAAYTDGFMADPLCNRVITEKMSLLQFAELDRVRNRQSAFLQPLGPKGCDFVGITEEYDRSVKLFQRLFCLEINITPQVERKNPDRLGSVYELEPDVRKKVLDLNQLDVETYREGRDRFHALCDAVGI